MITEQSSLEAGLAQFDDAYQQYYQQLMLQKLGFESNLGTIAADLITQTINFLRENEVSYHGFFAELSQEFNHRWRDDPSLVFADATFSHQLTDDWRSMYHKCLNQLPPEKMTAVGDRLNTHNPQTALLRPIIESVWQSISEENDWQPFNDLVSQLQ